MILTQTKERSEWGEEIEKSGKEPEFLTDY